MVRAIIGAIGGYVVMFIVIMVTFSAAYLVLGTERVFKPDSFDVSTTWWVFSLVAGLAAAVAGGLVCALIALPGSKAPMVLAGIVLVLGLLMAIPALMPSEDEAPAVRDGSLSNLEAMTQAKQPLVFALVNPFVGVVGIVLGAKLRGGGKASAA